MKLLSIGELVREHGRPDPFFSYKLLFHHPGSVLLNHVAEVFLNLGGSTPEKIPMSSPPKPLGGKWGQAGAAIISFKEPLSHPFPIDLLLDRESFPTLEDGEYYVQDLLSSEVLDLESSQVMGRIVAFELARVKSMESVVFIVQDKDGKQFSFPAQAIVWERFQTESPIPVDGLSRWAEATR